MEPDELLAYWMEHYAERLLRLAYVYVRDWTTAEDRVQDALVKAFNAASQLVNHENPFPWLARIVINECRLAQRRGWREIVTEFVPELLSVSTEEEFIGQEDSLTLHHIILSLPERYRVPVVLYYFDELSVNQIAEVVGTNPGTIKSRLARGREKIKKYWKEEMPGGFRSANQRG